MTRRERIIYLLDHLSDCLDPSGTTSGTGVSADGPGLPLLPAMSCHPSVVELGRCVAELKRVAPNHERCLWAYFGSGWIVVWEPERKGSKTVIRVDEHGRRVPVMKPRRARSVPAWLRAYPVDSDTREPRPVALAVDFVTGAFRGDVFVPSELLAA